MWLVPRHSRGLTLRTPVPDAVREALVRWYQGEGSEADHRANFARLARLCGLQPPPDPARWQGRVGWRVQTADKLPLAGPMPAMTAPPEDGAPRRRDMPREPRLYLLLALGARGLTLAPLLADLVAAQVAGSPWPLETRLAQAVDPARFHLRQVRRSGG